MLILQDPQILDISADPDKVKLMLNDLQLVLDDLQKRAFQYKSYQKNFKVMTTLYLFLKCEHRNGIDAQALSAMCKHLMFGHL